MQCAESSPHQGHSWRDDNDTLHVCIGVPHDRWNEGDE